MLEKYIVLDLETHLISLETPLPRPVCLSFADERGRADVIHFRDPRFWRLLREWLSDPGRVFVMQNGMAFDFPVLTHWAESLDDVRKLLRVLDEDRLTDTKVRGWLGDTAEGRLYGYTNIKGKLVKHTYDLAAMYYRATGVNALYEAKNDPNSWRLRYSELDNVPVKDWPKDAIDYVMGDVEHPLTVWRWQEERWGGDILFDEPAQVRAYYGLAIAAANGFHVDLEATKKYKAQLESRRVQLETQLVDVGLLHKAPRSGKVTAKIKPAQAYYLALCHDYDVDPVFTEPSKRFPNGQPSIKQETLDELSSAIPLDEHNPEMELLEGWLEYKQSGMLLTRDIEMLEKGRIGTSYGWAATGRLTSARSNMTNAARKGPLRECVIPRPGNALVSIDFNSAELVGVADICWSKFGFSRLGEALNAGLDPHILLGNDIAGHEITKDSEHRQFAKVGNFGRWGFMGADALVRSAKKQKILMDRGKAQDVIKKMEARWTELPKYLRWAKDVVENGGGYVESYRTGRYRKVERVAQAANTPFQGFVADMAKASNYALVKAWLLGQCDYMPCVEVHDESIGEAPLGSLHETAYQATRIILDTANTYLQYVEMRAAPAAMLRWHKKADTVLDKNGRLAVWHPTART